MVKFTAAGDDGRTLIGLGIEEGNVARLKKGQPIYIRLDDPEGVNLGLPLEIMIWYGQTAQDLANQVKPFITQHTLVHDSRPRKQ